MTKNQQETPLTLDEKKELEEIIDDFFKLKEDDGSDKPQGTEFLSFQKKCTSSNNSFFAIITKCNTTIIGRIQIFLTRLYQLLQKNENSHRTVLNPYHFAQFFSDKGRLKKLESCSAFKNLTFKNIQSAVDFLCGKNNDSCTKLTGVNKKLVDAMKLLFPNERSIELRSIELDGSQQDVIDKAKEISAEDTQNSTSTTKLPDVIDKLVSKIKEKGRTDILNFVILHMNNYINQTMDSSDLIKKLEVFLTVLSQDGGSRYVRRNKRKTKKEIKNKYKRSKKHHHRTKRHTKRHRKTKRHMKRHRNTKRY